MRTRPDLALLVLAVVALLADLACVLTGHTAPDLFGNLALAAFSAAAGLSLPTSRKTPTAQTPVQTPAELDRAEAILQSYSNLRTYSGPVEP